MQPCAALQASALEVSVFAAAPPGTCGAGAQPAAAWPGYWRCPNGHLKRREQDQEPADTALCAERSEVPTAPGAGAGTEPGAGQPEAGAEPCAVGKQSESVPQAPPQEGAAAPGGADRAAAGLAHMTL